MPDFLTQRVSVWVPLTVLIVGASCWALGLQTAGLEHNAIAFAVGAALIVAAGGSFLAFNYLATPSGSASAIDGASASKNNALIELEVARVVSLMRSRQMRE